MRDEPEKQERYFQLGETYFWLASQNEIVERALAPRLERLRAEAPGRPLRLFDLGCGPGNMLRRLGPWGRAIGSDFSLDALAYARSKGLRHLLSSDSTALPLRPASLDCLIALDVLEHIEDDRAALREIARVLRPGGVFLFAVPAFMALWRHHDVMYGHFRRYGRVEFLAKVRDAGLSVESCRFIKCAFFLPLLALAKFEHLAAGVRAPRDNFYAVPGWFNRLLSTEITWEDRCGLTRWLPFGVSLLCVGRR
ncbi:MAG TPA: class I SAM-dependent methyltransferase [Methylomirabilota bacterium]|nr:class I SAM-dependent methyltransferase [Methylomirabilota bacterium]